MNQRFSTDGVSRRNVLRTGAAVTGAGLVGGSGLVGSVGARRGNLISWINSDGNYAVFDSSGAYWRQSKNPLDLQDGDRRFVAEPASGGSLRCRIEGDVAPGNVGGYVNIGTLGDIDRVMIESEAVTEDAFLWIGLFFDVGPTGGYWEWQRIHGNTEQFVSLGEDPECLHPFPAGVDLDIDDDIDFGTLIIPYGSQPEGADEVYPPEEPEADQWHLFPSDFGGFAIAPENYSVTLGDFKNGYLDPEGVDYRIELNTDEDTTQVGLGLAVFASGGNEEAIIHDVTVD